MSKYRKYVVLFLIILSTIGFIWGTKVILNEEKFINVNSSNREIIKEALKASGIRNTGIKKIGIGQGWHRHTLYIHYYIGATEKLYIGEGSNYNITGEEYSMDTVAAIICVVSLLTLIMIFIYEIKRKRKSQF